MSNPQLSVEISANVSTLIDNLKTASQVIEAFGAKSYTGLNATEDKLKQMGDVTLKKLNQDLKVSQGYFQLFGDTVRKDVNNLSAYQTALTSLLNAGFRPTSKEVLQLAGNIEVLNKKIANSTSPFSKLGAGSNSAAFALSNLGRVAQDAPFGFIGIQNNLNPLLESFQRLRQEAGSNAGALKLLAGSLLGAGGIGLALSVVTSLLTFYTAWQQKAKKATEDKKTAVEDAKKALDEYVKSLDSATRASINGIVNSQKEVIVLQQLYAAARNLELPMAERIKAAKKLQDQYPKTFENFTAEQIALGKASAAYQQLSKDIIAVATAAARTEIITENAKEIVQLGLKNKELEKRKKLEEDALALASRKAKTERNAASFGNDGLISNTGADAVLAAVDLNNTTKEIATNEARRIKLNKENLGLQEQMNKVLTDTKSVVSITGLEEEAKTKKKVKDLKSLAEILAELKIDLKINNASFSDTFNEKRIADIESYQKAINDLIKNGFDPAGSAVKELVKQQDILATAIKGGQLGDAMQNVKLGGPLTGLTDTSIKVKDNVAIIGKSLAYLRNEFNYTDEELALFVEKYGLSLDEIKNLTIDFNQKLGEILNNGAISGLSDLGSAVGSALADGANIAQAAEQSLLSSLGGILIQLGELAIATGVGIKSIKTALKTLNPAIAIGAGVALVALGSIFKAKAASIGEGVKGSSGTSVKPIKAFASGVNNFSGGLALVGERGPELVNLPTGASVKNNAATNRLLSDGNNNNIILQGEFGLSLERLYWGLQEVDKRLGRRGAKR